MNESEIQASAPQAWTHQCPELVKALVRVQAELSNVEANREAHVRSEKGNYSYAYADLAEVYDVVRPLCSKHGIALTHDVWFDGPRVFVSTELLHESGQALRSVLSAPAVGTIQGNGGLITYLKRYGVSARFALATDRDDDANGASGNTATTGPRPAGGNQGQRQAPPQRQEQRNEPPRREPPSQGAPAQERKAAAPTPDPKPAGTIPPREELRTLAVTFARFLGALIKDDDEIDTLERAWFSAPIAHLTDEKVSTELPKFRAPTDKMKDWCVTKLKNGGLMRHMEGK